MSKLMSNQEFSSTQFLYQILYENSNTCYWRFAEENTKKALGKGFLSDLMHQISHNGTSILAAMLSIKWAKHKAIKMLCRQT